MQNRGWGAYLQWQAAYCCCFSSATAIEEDKVGDAAHSVLCHLRSPFGVLYIQHHKVDSVLELLLYLQTAWPVMGNRESKDYQGYTVEDFNIVVKLSMTLPESLSKMSKFSTSHFQDSRVGRVYSLVKESDLWRTQVFHHHNFKSIEAFFSVLT